MLYIKWLGHNNTLIRMRVYLLPPKDCCATATGYQMVRWKHARYITQWLPAPALACPMGLFWNTAASLAEAHPLTAKITKVQKRKKKRKNCISGQPLDYSKIFTHTLLEGNIEAAAGIPGGLVADL